MVTCGHEKMPMVTATILCVLCCGIQVTNDRYSVWQERIPRSFPPPRLWTVNIRPVGSMDSRWHQGLTLPSSYFSRNRTRLCFEVWSCPVFSQFILMFNVNIIMNMWVYMCSCTGSWSLFLCNVVSAAPKWQIPSLSLSLSLAHIFFVSIFIRP